MFKMFTKHLLLYYMLLKYSRCDIQSDEEMVILDFSQHSETETCMPKFKVIKLHHQGKIWIRYITLLLHDIIAQHHILYRLMQSVMSKSLSHSYSGITKVFHSCLLDKHSPSKSGNRFTSPIGQIHFKSWIYHTEELKWHITVNKYFMINISIYEAYVPYTETCTHQNIAIQEYRDGSTIAQFCGHTSMECVYTKYNVAQLLMNVMSTHYIAPYPPKFIASYQIHAVGLAYRFDYPCSSANHRSKNNGIIHVDQQPSFSVYISRHLHYFWYLSNSIYSHKMPLIGIMQVVVSVLQCEFDSTSLSVYPGILNWYRATYQVLPLHRLTCDNTTLNVINITSHMYATVKLTMFYLDSSLTLAMVFTEVHQYVQKINLGAKGILTEQNKILQSGNSAHSRLQILYFAATHASLTLDSFKCAGPLHSVPSYNIIKQNLNNNYSYEVAPTTEGIYTFILHLNNIYEYVLNYANSNIHYSSQLMCLHFPQRYVYLEVRYYIVH